MDHKQNGAAKKEVAANLIPPSSRTGASVSEEVLVSDRKD